MTEESQTFKTALLAAGKTATGIRVPDEVVAALGPSKKPAVNVRIGSYTYRSSVASMGGQFMLPVSAEHRAGAGIAAGDEVEVTLSLDSAPREVTVPEDFVAALDTEPEAKRFFESLAYSHKLRHVLSINEAKTPETRERRVAKAIEMLREGRK